MEEVGCGFWRVLPVGGVELRERSGESVALDEGDGEDEEEVVTELHDKGWP